MLNRQISATTRCSSRRNLNERQRAPFQPPEAVFDQVFAAIRRDALGQAQPLSGVIGRIDAPAQALHGVGERRLTHVAHTRTRSLRTVVAGRVP